MGMDKNFIQFLKTHNKTIVEEWISGTIATYPGETARTLKNSDEFANPVGATLSDALSKLFHTLLESPDPASLAKAIEPIIRIRAIQTFNASEAIRFVFFLKKILRELVQKEGKTQFISSLSDFELFIDQTALSAFNVYTECKQAVYELKAQRAEKQVSTLLKKAGFLVEHDAPKEQPPECNTPHCGSCTPDRKHS